MITRLPPAGRERQVLVITVSVTLLLVMAAIMIVVPFVYVISKLVS